MFANVGIPVYGLTFWNEAYQVNDVAVNFYRSMKRRDKVAEGRKKDGFNVRIFDIHLPDKAVTT